MKINFQKYSLFFRIFPILEVQIGTIFQHPASPLYKPLYGKRGVISTPVLLAGGILRGTSQNPPHGTTGKRHHRRPATVAAGAPRTVKNRGVNRLQKFFAWKPLTAPCRCAVRQLREVRRGLRPLLMNECGNGYSLNRSLRIFLTSPTECSTTTSRRQGRENFLQRKAAEGWRGQGVSPCSHFTRGKV